MKTTPWFPGRIKPVHVGVYQTDGYVFQYWNGDFWGSIAHSVDWAYVYRNSESLYQAPSWRGVAK